ncbi:unnamed protein product [Mytilus edulis]|uniref:DZIP3-like HEPN domain-containing protein n=1 Tax=Mytilus edulis TaxID=6550 RepID=A0A8S3S259_MYTED|nr:unnamed protein product [Mytilus edulis]
MGNVPHDAEVQIGDDVQRILNATDHVISRKSDEISELCYEEFQKRTQELLIRVDNYLCQDTSIQLYQTIQSSDIDITDMLQQLALMQPVNVIQIVDEESENVERYSRVSRVITDTFPNILRDIIRSNISACNLYQLCLPHITSFSPDQQTVLNDANSSNSYDSMDITLIYKLLRQFLLINPPTKRWGSNPDKADIKLADDVERIRRYRNHLAHRCNTNIGKDEFDDYFDKFRDIVQLESRPIKFFWGESFETSLRNLRTTLKDEKSEEEINNDLSGIEFIVASEGSVVLHVELLVQLLETDELLQSTLTLFLRKILERIPTSNTESIDMVLLPVEEFTPWIAPKTIGKPVYLELDIEAELFESNYKMGEQLRKISDTIFKHSSGSGTNNDITAILLPICLENTTTTEESFIQAQIPVKYNLPVSATLLVNIKTVAVSCKDNRIILIINISTHSVISTIRTRDHCWGISYNDNNLYVVIDGSIIDVMDLTGKVIRTIPLPSDHIHNITVDRNRLVCIDISSIYRCSLDGKLIWKFQEDGIQDFQGVTTDNDGNVYVINYNINTVVVVSYDRTNYRELLTESDGLNWPREFILTKRKYSACW